MRDDSVSVEVRRFVWGMMKFLGLVFAQVFAVCVLAVDGLIMWLYGGVTALGALVGCACVMVLVWIWGIEL